MCIRDRGAGNALSGLLAPGWYVMREVAVPDGVDFDPDEAPYYAVYVSSVLDPQVEGTEDQSFVIENRFVTNNTYKNTPILNISAYGQVMITKASAQNNATKVNATFKVQQQQPNGVYTDYMAGNSVMTITVDKTKDYAISSMLPVGNYQLVEIAVESGYTLDATPVRFAIQANKITGAGNLSEDVYLPLDTDAAPTPIVFTNNQKGGLELTKKGNILGVENPLSNVTFQLYAVTGSGLDPQGDCAVGKTVVGTGVTNGNGLLSITGIDAGTYWLKEASVGTNNAANGFEPGMIVQVTIQPGQTTRVYTDLQGSVHSNGILQNTTTYGKLQIVKVDEHERTLPVSGATFNVYAAGDLAQAVDQITTDPLGVAITKLLPVGDYVLKEVSAKEGYFLDTQTVWGPYAIVANQTTTTQDGTPITITNERQQTVNIIKKGSTTLTEIISPEAMSAAVFELYANKTDEEPLQTARHGALSFTELRPLTTYYIKEVVPPTGYTLEQGSDGWYQVTTGNDGTTEVTIYNDPLGAITINKVIKWQNPDEDHLVSFPFRGVTFSLYHYEEDAPDHIGSLVETNTTGDGGALTFSNLVPGQYVLQETVPDDYTADNGVTTWILTVTKGTTNTELPVPTLL